MKTILHTADIAAPAKDVYAALTTESKLAGWWTTSVEADIREGGVIHFSFGGDFNPDMKITALQPGKRVAWTCVAGHGPWRDNSFSFTVEARGEGSILFFRQEYAQELSDEEYGRYNYNWGYYLESLRLLVEDGKGHPYRAK